MDINTDIDKIYVDTNMISISEREYEYEFE